MVLRAVVWESVSVRDLSSPGVRICLQSVGGQAVRQDNFPLPSSLSGTPDAREQQRGRLQYRGSLHLWFPSKSQPGATCEAMLQSLGSNSGKLPGIRTAPRDRIGSEFDSACRAVLLLGESALQEPGEPGGRRPDSQRAAAAWVPTLGWNAPFTHCSAGFRSPSSVLHKSHETSLLNHASAQTHIEGHNF